MTSTVDTIITISSSDRIEVSDDRMLIRIGKYNGTLRYVHASTRKVSRYEEVVCRREGVVMTLMITVRVAASHDIVDENIQFFMKDTLVY